MMTELERHLLDSLARLEAELIASSKTHGKEVERLAKSLANQREEISSLKEQSECLLELFGQLGLCLSRSERP